MRLKTARLRTGLATVMTVAMLAGTAHAASFIDAVKNDDTAQALQMLKAGADPNAAMENGTTALHWAVYNDDMALVDALLKAGARADTRNDYGSSPMSEAAVLGNADLIKKLLKAGADPESPNADGQTALMIVARSNNVKAAEVFIKAGADVNATETWKGQTAVIWAAAQSQPEMLKLLLKHGGDPDARSIPERWDRQITSERRYQWRPAGGLTALIYAAREGCQECARALVEAGADIDLADDGGTSPLLAAIINKHFDTAKYLVEAGANVDKWSERGENPVYSAVDMNTLPHGGYPDRPSTDETSAIEMLKILLDHGANPNLQLKLQPIYRSLKDDRGADSMLSTGATPLLRAAKAFDLDSMKLLVEHGAHLDLPNRNGITPVMAAAGLGSSSIDTRGDYTVPDVGERSRKAVQFLVEHGADINATDQYGRTALHGAAGWGWNEPIEYLVAQGADPTAEAQGGMTPLDSANGKSISRFGRGGGGDKHPDTIKLLEQLIQDQQGESKPGV